MNKLLCFLFGHIKEKCGQKCASCSRCYKFFGEWWKTSEDHMTKQQAFDFIWGEMHSHRSHLAFATLTIGKMVKEMGEKEFKEYVEKWFYEPPKEKEARKLLGYDNAEEMYGFSQAKKRFERNFGISFMLKMKYN